MPSSAEIADAAAFASLIGSAQTYLQCINELMGNCILSPTANDGQLGSHSS